MGIHGVVKYSETAIHSSANLFTEQNLKILVFDDVITFLFTPLKLNLSFAPKQ